MKQKAAFGEYDCSITYCHCDTEKSDIYQIDTV